MTQMRIAAWGLGALWAALAIAACGSGGGANSGQAGTATAASPTGKNSPIALARCMRAHGLSNFPDPGAGGAGPGLQIGISPGSSAVTVNGVTFDGPAFHAAQKACKQFFPGGNEHPPPLSASQRAQALRFAQCMREHGVPSFPDPTFPRNGGILLRGDRAFNPQSPAFQQAQAACGGKP